MGSETLDAMSYVESISKQEVYKANWRIPKLILKAYTISVNALNTVYRKIMVRKLNVWNEKFIDYVETHVTWSRPCILQIEMAEGEDENITHRKYFVLNDNFEDILDTLGNSKEIGNDFEEDSGSVSNTKVIYYAYLFFNHLF